MTLRTLLALTVPCLLAGQPNRIDKDAIRAHLAILADDLFEGRGMGQRGGDLAVKYLETQLRAIGLRPAHGDSFLQPVKLAGMLSKPGESRVVLEGQAGPLEMQLGKDFFMVPLGPTEKSTLDAPLVFVGHGICAGKEGRDDYKGMDVRGKVIVMLMGERSETSATSPCCTPGHYYGRWTHKLEEGVRRGAAAILIVHTATSARYDWSVVVTGWRSERFVLENGPGATTLAGLMREETAQKLFASVGLDLDALQKRADGLDFHPIELNLRARGVVAAQVRHLVQYNVAGLLPGTDPVLKNEYVIYSAHWDHFGKRADGRFFNGAVDNASGCAAALAIAQAAVRAPARRSQLFLFPTGEEAGLLGATAYVRSPLRPLEKTAAVLNLESLNFLGATKDIAALGADASELGDHARRVAKAMGLRFRGTAPDPAGLFFRSDHFPFVRSGVPAVSPGFSLDGGWDYVRDPAQSQAKAEGYLRDGYHQPSDRYDPAWDLEGMTQQTQFVFQLGKSIANSPQKLRWKEGVPDFGGCP